MTLTVELTHKACPFTDCGSSDAFSYNEEKGVGFCHSCGKAYPHKRMSIHDWAKKEYPLMDHKPPLRLVDETPSMENKVQFTPDGYRGISKKTREFYNCTGVLEDGDLATLIYRYPNGSVKYRAIPKTFSTGAGFRSDSLFGMDRFPAGSAQAVTITEGEEDAMAAFQMHGSKYPVVSLPSATPSRKLLENCKDWLGSFDKIYLSIDTDDKAENFAIALLNLFPGKVYHVPHGDYKDANDFLMAGKQREYVAAWWSSKLFTPDNIYATSEDFLGLLRDTPDHAYVPTGIEALDDKILGLMQGHFTVIKAPTGIGKSEFMRYLEHNLVANHPDVPFAVWHLEETKLRSLLGIVSYVLQDNLTRKDLIQEKNKTPEVEKAIERITQSGYMQFHLREEDGAEELVNQIRVLSQVYGCKYVFFEPIQDVITVSDDKQKEAVLADLSVRLSKLAADLAIGIVTIAHTNENGDPKYCKMIGQRASVIINLERDKEAADLIDRNTTKITVQKNRPCGLEGKAGELLFDLDTFTLSEKKDTF